MAAAGRGRHAYFEEVFEPYIVPLRPDGRPAGELLRISTGGVDIDAESLAMVAAGDRFAIAWADDRTGDVEVYLSQVSCE
jgi:hypothetical protein